VKTGEHRPSKSPVARNLTIVLAAAAIVAPIVAGLVRTRGATEPPAAGPAPTGPPATSPAATPDPHRSVVAEAVVPAVRVFDEPGGERTHTLDNPTETGAPLVFLVEHEGEGWHRVLLPVRPNGSTGWVRDEDVSLAAHRFRVEVELARHRIRVWKAGEVFLKAPIAVGTEDTPTPGGRFYIKELLRPPDPNSIYGAYAYGLSGFSNVYRSFNGGEGVIGIHGTNDPSVIGTDVSAGCIRMTNEDIEKLVPVLPLGTPVDILP